MDPRVADLGESDDGRNWELDFELVHRRT